MKFYKLVSKPLLDFIFSLLAILILAPLLIILLIMQFIYYSGSPFFIQERPGKNGHIFKLIKFKTMNDDMNENGKLLSDSKRLTSFGRFLRQTSLDELPQIFNVLKGDMSLVGPRPLLVDYLSLYNDFQKRRHEVKPGITGLAQIKGRTAIRWVDKFRLDIWYIDNFSFLLDMKIIWLTIPSLFKKKWTLLQDTQSCSITSDSFSWDD